MEVFIPNTNKRYSINTRGIVFSNYRYLQGNVKWFIKKPIAKHKNTKQSASPSVSLIIEGGYMCRSVSVYTLMTKAFKIKPPDNKHFYDTTSKNGDFYDCSLKNIAFKIRLKEADEKYYPRPFYNKKGVIIAKICSYCGLKKDISCFSLQIERRLKGGISKETYRNMTESCRGKKQWTSLKNDAKRLKKAIVYKKKWEHSKRGIAYRKTYGTEYRERHKKELSPIHIHRYFKLYEIGIKPKDLTPNFIKLAKKYILTYNKIKQIKNGNN